MTVKELVADLLYCNADSNVVLEDDVEFTDEHGKVSGSCYQIEKVVKHGRSASLHFDNRQHFMRKQESILDKIRVEIDDATEIHSDGEFYIKNIDVKRIIDRYTKDGE